MTEVRGTATREDLAKLFQGVGVEVGVERGKFSEVICKNNPDTLLYCVDPWKLELGYRDHVTQDMLDEFYKETTKRLQHFNAILVRKTSKDAAYRDFADDGLDFVYIDARHDYHHAFQDITTWYAKVKHGGIVSGHDYVNRKDFGVVDAVKDFAKANGIELVSIYAGDTSPSWMFYKP